MFEKSMHEVMHTIAGIFFTTETRGVTVSQRNFPWCVTIDCSEATRNVQRSTVVRRAQAPRRRNAATSHPVFGRRKELKSDLCHDNHLVRIEAVACSCMRHCALAPVFFLHPWRLARS